MAPTIKRPASACVFPATAGGTLASSGTGTDSDPIVPSVLGKGYPALITGSLTTPGTTATYTAGYYIGNSALTPLEFTTASSKGAILGATMAITPASGQFLYAAADFSLVLYKKDASIPLASGSYPADNAQFTPSSLSVARSFALNRICQFDFSNSLWRNGAGQLVSSTTSGNVYAALCAIQTQADFAGLCQRVFDLSATSYTTTICGMLFAKSAYAPTAIAQTIDVTLYTYND
jgi:hypothetical protein